MPARRDIVLARFPFTDRSGTKIRPVLVLAETPGVYRDFIVVFISSQIGQAVADFDLILEPAHPSFGGSGLKTASVFRIAKSASLSAALLRGTLGQLDEVVFDEIISRLARLLVTGQSGELGT